MSGVRLGLTTAVMAGVAVLLLALAGDPGSCLRTLRAAPGLAAAGGAVWPAFDCDRPGPAGAASRAAVASSVALQVFDMWEPFRIAFAGLEILAE